MLHMQGSTDGRVNGIPPLPQDLEAGVGSQGMGRRDHAILGRRLIIR
jgi:hypothetical protein